MQMAKTIDSLDMTGKHWEEKSANEELTKTWMEFEG
jgi:hypothetical protein